MYNILDLYRSHIYCCITAYLIVYSINMVSILQNPSLIAGLN